MITATSLPCLLSPKWIPTCTLESPHLNLCFLPFSLLLLHSLPDLAHLLFGNNIWPQPYSALGVSPNLLCQEPPHLLGTLSLLHSLSLIVIIEGQGGATGKEVESWVFSPFPTSSPSNWPHSRHCLPGTELPARQHAYSHLCRGGGKGEDH